MTGIQAPLKELKTSDSDISKFNHNLSLLIYQLSKAYPEDRDLKLWSDKFEWGKRFNAKIACEYFVYMTESFIKEIMVEDVNFFLNFNYGSRVENQEYLRLIHKIVDVWQTTGNPKMKTNIWRYFQTLLTYSIKATKREDLRVIINQYRSTPLIF